MKVYNDKHKVCLMADFSSSKVEIVFEEEHTSGDKPPLSKTRIRLELCIQIFNDI